MKRKTRSLEVVETPQKAFILPILGTNAKLPIRRSMLDLSAWKDLEFESLVMARLPGPLADARGVGDYLPTLTSRPHEC